MCLLPPNKHNWRLYDLLELDESVTAKQVKWSFRRVKLRSHYQKAYYVLYSRTRKHLYDAIGEDVYGFLVSGTWGPLISSLSAAGSVNAYCLTMLVQVALLALFFVFLAAKVENFITWGWDYVILPLMVFGMIMNFFTFLSVIVNVISVKTYKEGMSFVDRLSPIGNCLASVCYSCIPFVIASAIVKSLDEKVGQYTLYMCMPILGDVLYYLTSLIWRWPQRLRHQIQINDNHSGSGICYGIFFMAFLNMGCGVAQWVLLGKKLDGKFNHSWYIVFIPLCARAGVRVLEALLRSLMRYAMYVRTKAGVVFDVIGSFLSNGLLLISLYFVAVLLERGDHPYSLFLALIPVYATLGYIFLGLLITMGLLLVRVSRSAAVERRIHKVWIPPEEDDDDKSPVTGRPLNSNKPSDGDRAVLASRIQEGSGKEDQVTYRGRGVSSRRGPSLEPFLVRVASNDQAAEASPLPVVSRGVSRERVGSSRPRPYDRGQSTPSRHSNVHHDPFKEEMSTTDDYESGYYTPSHESEDEYEYVSDYEYMEGSQSSRMSSSTHSSPILRPQSKG